MAPDDATFLLQRYVLLHNEGVRYGSFAPMLTLFADGAEVRFDGLPFGPFVGRGAIGSAFAEHPPTDELIVIGNTSSAESEATARYGWQSEDGVPAGRIKVTAAGGRIAALTITVRP